VTARRTGFYVLAAAVLFPLVPWLMPAPSAYALLLQLVQRRSEPDSLAGFRKPTKA
jgi:hypothetical protein